MDLAGFVGGVLGVGMLGLSFWVVMRVVHVLRVFLPARPKRALRGIGPCRVARVTYPSLWGLEVREL
jgi:hypothetical protein